MTGMRNRWMVLPALLAVCCALGAWAAPEAVEGHADIFDLAIGEALEQARVALDAAPRLEGVERVGVAGLEGDVEEAVCDLLRSMLTRTRFEVVLTDDAEWAPLLDEFARQVQREDIILPETAHELRVQGVDAVLYGTVRDLRLDPVEEAGQAGGQVTVTLLLSLASLDEASPGSLLWSEQFTGSARELAPMSREEQALSAFRRNRLTVLAVAAVVLLGVVFVLYRRAMQPR